MNLNELQAYVARLERENKRMEDALVSIEAELSDRADVTGDSESLRPNWAMSLQLEALAGLGMR